MSGSNTHTNAIWTILMGADMVLYGSSKHEEYEVEKIEVPSDATKPSRIIAMAKRKRSGA